MITKPKLLSSFSGGKTSAAMTKLLLQNCGDAYDIKVVFANTGEENRKTLEFVDLCDREFGFGTAWVESVPHIGERKSSTHKVVTFTTASRDGKPFEQMIQKYGIPNMSFPHCTRELKLNPIKSYLASIGWTEYITAVGIRLDESRRVSASADAAKIIYPLRDMFPMDKQDVNTYCDDHGMILGIQEHEGNCQWCWKKSEKKLLRQIKESPIIFEFPRRMESKYGMVGPNPVGGPRVFFRGNRSTYDLFHLADQIDLEAAKQSRIDFDVDSGCSESCELFDMETVQ